MESGFINNLPEWFEEYDPQLLLGIAAFLVLIVILFIFSLLRKGKKKSSMPTLIIESFQIAPLGRDAFLKINNPSVPVTLINVEIIDQTGLEVKNQVGGHILATGTNYSILLEVKGNHRINPDFKIAMIFVNDQRQTYRQVFNLNPIESISLKRKRN